LLCSVTLVRTMEWSVLLLVCIQLRDPFQRSHQIEGGQSGHDVRRNWDMTSDEVLDEPFSSNHSLCTDRICSEQCHDKGKLCSWRKGTGIWLLPCGDRRTTDNWMRSDFSNYMRSLLGHTASLGYRLRSSLKIPLVCV
jgi:hypothetical protein